MDRRVHQADRRDRVLAAGRGVEPPPVDGVGDQQGVVVVVTLAGDLGEPRGDDDLLHGEPPGRLDPPHREVRPDLVMLDEVDLGPLARRERGGPLGGLPPRRDDDVGVGDVDVGDRAGVVEDPTLGVDLVEMRTLDRGVPRPGAVEDQRAGDLPPRRLRLARRDDRDVVTALVELLGVDGLDPMAAGEVERRAQDGDLHAGGDLCLWPLGGRPGSVAVDVATPRLATSGRPGLVPDGGRSRPSGTSRRDHSSRDRGLSSEGGPDPSP